MAPKSFSGIPNNTEPSWWNDACLRTNVLQCIATCLCVFYLGYDQSLLTGLQSVPVWNTYFGSPAGNGLGLIAAAIFIPGIFFPLVGDYISLNYGRRWAIRIGSVLIIIGAIMNALSTTRGMFIGSRVIIGTGGSITKVGAPALVQELAHPRLRSQLGTIYYSFYYTGSLTSACMCIAGLYVNGNWGWRMPCLVQILGPIVVLISQIWIPESPRFLVKKGRNEEAKRVLTKHHANGQENDPLVEWEYQEIVQTLRQEEEAPKSSWVDLLKTPGNRRRLIITLSCGIGSNWVGNGIVSYYLTPALKQVGITSPQQQTGINAGLAVWNLILAQLAGYYVDRIGRRTLFFISTSGMIVSYAFVMGFGAAFAQTKLSNYGIAAIPFLFFFYGFYDIAWTPLPIAYGTELMPYNLRTKGLSVVVISQNAANAFNQFVNPIALAALTWKYYAVYIGVDFIWLLIIYLYFPETKGLTIEEVSTVCDYGRLGGRKAVLEDVKAHTTAIENTGRGVDEKTYVEHVEQV